MTYIGIDVSKDTFVVAYSPEKASKTRTFKNTTKGIHEFIQTVSKDKHHCVMEGTGNYSALLVYLLSEAGITTSLENPLKVKNFARVMLSTVKTDEVDARLIALYGEKMNPAPYKLRSEAILTLKQKRTVIRQLKKQLIATKNLKGSMEVLPFFDSKCRKSIEQAIAFLEKQVKHLEEDLSDLANSEYKKQMDLLTSIKGIGVTLAAALIMATGGFTYFDNAKQLTRYLGLSPSYQQSGTSVNFKGHINRNGDSSLRSQLYVAAFSSLRCNAECRACYDRLRSNGKSGKLAVIAVANKLVRQAFAVVTQQRPYVDGYVSTLRSAPASSETGEG
ncbi:IS110 family transposase [Prevotella dentasini]|uniref:IS110 family transposase n=1 Tax=Prevotella dentasini TaxID=589537 RepID=UPI000469EF8E|nr:IS110 family transposase [Prevotella dentasini]